MNDQQQSRADALTAHDALAAIETFEIVGDNNDSREPNAEDRFLLTEFVAHLFGGFRVEVPEARATSANETGAEGAAGFAHELWAAAQLAPSEGIEDGVQRIAAILSHPCAMAAAEPNGAVRAYGVFRTRFDENDGKEFFYHANWHNEYLPQEGERIVEGWFVPAMAAAAPTDEQAPDRARDKEIEQLIDERDSFECMGTALAEKVAELFGIDVGEWSSANNPIFRAIHIVEDEIARAAASPAAEDRHYSAKDVGSRCANCGHALTDHDGGRTCPSSAPQPAQASPAAAIPAGWKLVPIEPTEEMIAVGVGKGDADFYGDPLVKAEVRSDYQSMIAAAPQPAQADAQDVPADDLVGFVYVLENPDRPHDPITRFSRGPRSVKGLGAKIISLTPVYSRPAQADAPAEAREPLNEVLFGNDESLEMAADALDRLGQNSAAEGVRAIAYELRMLATKRGTPADAGEARLTDEHILDAFRNAGVDLNATPNMAYTVRGQQAQLVNAVRALLNGADHDR
ncbi:hypothetical protein WT27_23845 [Burkholderia territorii]|uniref:Uncharacterized protein n=1 Tax=Burkholderia territorii TaxID=1503055 RepID=A0A119B0P4_9BURK|nr:hypothetical protein [Burkholderia territorii]KVV57965.1 hypothetical protein WT27_23845 [Burkholderia territorii]KVX46864.1 hypothetical protein WT31_21515 [Burkholderia territorii]